jgi:hypothetical protein
MRSIVALIGAGITATVLALPADASGDLVRAQDVPLGIPAYDVANADFNRDGKQDLALPDRGHAVEVLLGNGDGTFEPGGSFRVGAGPNLLALADLNRDGKKDIVTTNYGSDSISVLLGRGDGNFMQAIGHRIGDGPLGLSVGRVNRDRRPDLAVANVHDNTVSVLMGEGHGKFGHRHDYAAGRSPQSAAIADLNGDGRRDLAVADFEHPAILMGRSDGTFRRRRYIGTGLFLSPSDVIAAHVNRDRITDLLVTSLNFDGQQGTWVFLGREDRGFTQPTQYPMGPPTKIALRDMTGDGRKDLVAEDEGDYEGDPGYLYVLRGSGDGTFEPLCHGCAPPYFLDTLDGAGGRFATGDFDGNGRRDIAAITYAGGPKLEILLNQ